MIGEIIKTVFFDVTIYCYGVNDEQIVTKTPIAFLVIQTDDPDTIIMPIAAKPTDSWLHMEAEIVKKDQRFMENASFPSTIKEGKE